MLLRLLILSLLLLKFHPLAAADPTPAPEVFGLELEEYKYPYAVEFLPLTIDGQAVRMAYMDVRPDGTGLQGTVVLLHGKNFMGAYWRDTIAALHAAGWRVVVPDQVGFGKSTKAEIPYSFHLLAANTKALLDRLQIPKAVVVGHSMGGMVATRFAIEYPGSTERLVLVNPIGLEDYRRGVAWAPLEKQIEKESKQTPEGIRKYFQSYTPKWDEKYEEWVRPQAAWTRHPDFPKLARVNALTYSMIYQQPVCYEFDRVEAPTLLIIGQEDRTVVGKDALRPEMKGKMGNYPELGRRTRDAIKGSKLVELEGIGHLPHLEAPERFQAELVGFLEGS